MSAARETASLDRAPRRDEERPAVPIDAPIDVLIVGAGMAGASLAARLVPERRVVLIERESRPGYHSTGRSAAIYTEVYGNATIRALTRASRPLFQDPPDGFAEAPLWQPIDAYLIGTAAQQHHVTALFEEVRDNAPGVAIVPGAELAARVPICRPGVVASAVKDGGAHELDVGAIHQGFLRQFTRGGGRLVADAEVTALDRRDGLWHVETRAGAFRADILVNAAGAWADPIAERAGAVPKGLTPMRRSVCLVAAPDGVSTEGWPMAIDVEERHASLIQDEEHWHSVPEGAENARFAFVEAMEIA